MRGYTLRRADDAHHSGWVAVLEFDADELEAIASALEAGNVWSSLDQGAVEMQEAALEVRKRNLHGPPA